METRDAAGRSDSPTTRETATAALAMTAEMLCRSLARDGRLTSASPSAPTQSRTPAALADARLTTEPQVVLRAELRPEVVQCVQRLKADGARPEDVLVAVKDAVSRAARAELPPRDAERVVSQAAQWAIESYYPAD